MGPGDLNSGLGVCVASALFTKSTPSVFTIVIIETGYHYIALGSLELSK